MSQSTVDLQTGMRPGDGKNYFQNTAYFGTLSQIPAFMVTASRSQAAVQDTRAMLGMYARVHFLAS